MELQGPVLSPSHEVWPGEGEGEQRDQWGKSIVFDYSCMPQARKRRGVAGHDLKGTSSWERGREVAQYRVLPEGDRQEGCLSSQLSVKSCGLARSPASICQLRDAHLLWPLGLAWEVSICVQKAGLLPKVTAERMPLLVERDARTPCPAASLGCHTLMLAVPMQPNMEHTVGLSHTLPGSP